MAKYINIEGLEHNLYSSSEIASDPEKASWRAGWNAALQEIMRIAEEEETEKN